MKEIPILFSTEMVQAILDGRKTMTRRVMKVQPDDCSDNHKQYNASWADKKMELYPLGESLFACKYCGYGVGPNGDSLFKSPYGQVGDVLWVRETFCPPNGYGTHVDYMYKADWELPKTNSRHDIKWKPNIHMPKAACRIKLRINNIRVERLQDITEQDAIAEGVEQIADYGTTGYKLYTQPDAAFSDIDAKWSFESLWQSINGPKSWDANPWVWVIEFERMEL